MSITVTPMGNFEVESARRSTWTLDLPVSMIFLSAIEPGVPEAAMIVISLKEDIEETHFLQLCRGRREQDIIVY